MVLLVMVFLASGFFTVGPQQRAIILRFGKPRGRRRKRPCSGPGFIGRSRIRSTSTSKSRLADIQQVSSTVGWYAVTPEQMLAGIEPPAAGTLNPIVMAMP